MYKQTRLIGKDITTYSDVEKEILIGRLQLTRVANRSRRATLTSATSIFSSAAQCSAHHTLKSLVTRIFDNSK